MIRPGLGAGLAAQVAQETLEARRVSNAEEPAAIEQILPQISNELLAQLLAECRNEVVASILGMPMTEITAVRKTLGVREPFQQSNRTFLKYAEEVARNRWSQWQTEPPSAIPIVKLAGMIRTAAFATRTPKVKPDKPPFTVGQLTVEVKRFEKEHNRWPTEAELAAYVDHHVSTIADRAETATKKLMVDLIDGCLVPTDLAYNANMTVEVWTPEQLAAHFGKPEPVLVTPIVQPWPVTPADPAPTTQPEVNNPMEVNAAQTADAPMRFSDDPVQPARKESATRAALDKIFGLDEDFAARIDAIYAAPGSVGKALEREFPSAGQSQIYARITEAYGRLGREKPKAKKGPGGASSPVAAQPVETVTTEPTALPTEQPVAPVSTAQVAEPATNAAAEQWKLLRVEVSNHVNGQGTANQPQPERPTPAAAPVDQGTAVESQLEKAQPVMLDPDRIQPLSPETKDEIQYYRSLTNDMIDQIADLRRERDRLLEHLQADAVEASMPHLILNRKGSARTVPIGYPLSVGDHWPEAIVIDNKSRIAIWECIAVGDLAGRPVYSMKLIKDPLESAKKVA